MLELAFCVLAFSSPDECITVAWLGSWRRSIPTRAWSGVRVLAPLLPFGVLPARMLPGAILSIALVELGKASANIRSGGDIVYRRGLAFAHVRIAFSEVLRVVNV